MEREHTGKTSTIENKNREPFVIRSHHIETLADFLFFNGSATEYINKLVELQKSVRSNDPNENMRISWYINDILGSTQEQTDKFISTFKDFLETFSQLDSNHPVKIVQYQKDGMCQRCAIGEHCKIIPRHIPLLESDSDIDSIKYFRNLSKKNNLHRQFTTVKENAVCSDGKTRRVKSILTTAETVKKVLSKGI